MRSRAWANFHGLSYWLRPEESRRLSSCNLSGTIFTSDLLEYTMDAMLRLSLSISGETRTSFFTAYFLSRGDKFLIFLPRTIRPRPSACGIWRCNHWCAQPG